MTQTLRITPVYDLLLRGSAITPIGLYHLYLMTAEQLTRLHYQMGTLTTVKARLKNLADHGYVQADAIPTKLFKSPYYYTLGQKGIRYLEDLGLDVPDSLRASRETDKHALFIEHTLELNDLLIAAQLLHQHQPMYALYSFTHERTLKRRPFQARWRLQRGETAIPQSYSLVPDAFLDFRITLGDGQVRRMPVLLEHDRGTEEMQHFRRRIRAYITMLKSEAYKEFFGVRTIITVAFTTFVSELRLKQMRQWTLQELQVSHEMANIGMLFYFTYVQPPLRPERIWLEKCWYTPYESSQPTALLGG